jgi:hypothetical protein
LQRRIVAERFDHDAKLGRAPERQRELEGCVVVADIGRPLRPFGERPITPGHEKAPKQLDDGRAVAKVERIAKGTQPLRAKGEEGRSD